MMQRLRPILFSLLVLVIGLCLVEVGIRVVFAFKVGPDVLVYGTPFYSGGQEQFSYKKKSEDDHTVSQHENAQSNYSKYFPNQKRVDNDLNGNTFTVTINDRGFRGRNFTTEKEPGVIRVVTLGASSTFGYRNRDEETYPRQMEEMLNRSGTGTYEVINLGIPHLKSENIYALFLEEALPLDPDIVTFYEGVNDAAAPRGLKRSLPGAMPALKKTLHAIRKHSLTLAYLHAAIFSKSRRLNRDQVETYMEGRSETFFQNLTLLLDECRQRDILFILGSQQSTSTTFAREELKGMTYEEEKEICAGRLAGTGTVSLPEAVFLAHARIMEQEDGWVSEHKVPFADVIEAMDQDRDCLLSWVHVNPEGNRIIASAFTRKILEAGRGEGHAAAKS